jgi:putative endonuclease
VFIEVKCRRSGVFGLPEESITRRRYEHLRLAAEEYRVARDLSETPCRVDVLAIEVGPDGRVARSRLLRNVEPPASR